MNSENSEPATKVSPEVISKSMMAWDWEKTDPDRSGSSGDVSKLFRHERAKSPGVLKTDAPPPNATVMAREVIQNSWDAARDLRSSLKGSDQDAPPFELEFEYRDLVGEEKEEIIDKLHLNTLASRLEDKDRQNLGLRQHDCLEKISSAEALPLLYIREKGTTGMYGPWEGAKSKIYQALVSIGYTDKDEGSGGSYGYGKAGLIRASAIRSVLAYTCFKERRNDEGVTRRALGMTYWGQHSHGDESYTGFARMADENRRPFENDQADQIARELGMSLRAPDKLGDLGTTFLLVDPTVQPNELKKAVERWWWPAIDNEDFFVSIVTPDGDRIHPRPRKDETLRPFIRAHEIATTRQDNSPEEEDKTSFNAIEKDDTRYDNPGNLGLVADLEGWSYADQTVSNVKDGEPVEHRSLVALMRDPNMVVEYYDAGQTAPYVRGSFVAGIDVNETLRKTEPKGHDAWRTTSDDGGEIGEHAADVAKTILNRIRGSVNRFRSNLKPPSPPPEDIQLSHFDDIMQRVMTGGSIGGNPPVGETRSLSIRLEDRELEPVRDGEVQLSGIAKISLSEHYDGEQAEISVKIKYRFIEDDKLGSSCPIAIEPPDGFEARGDNPKEFVGTLTREEEAKFEFLSDSYSSDWTARLIVNADVVKKSEED